MKQEHLETLSKIYNTLLLVHTKGQDTMVMSDCLKALQSLMTNMSNDLELTLGEG